MNTSLSRKLHSPLLNINPKYSELLSTRQTDDISLIHCVGNTQQSLNNYKIITSKSKFLQALKITNVAPASIWVTIYDTLGQGDVSYPAQFPFRTNSLLRTKVQAILKLVFSEGYSQSNSNVRLLIMTKSVLQKVAGLHTQSHIHITSITINSASHKLLK